MLFRSEIARHKVVSAAKRTGISLKQTYAKECKTLRRKAGGYAGTCSLGTGPLSQGRQMRVCDFA